MSRVGASSANVRPGQAGRSARDRRATSQRRSKARDPTPRRWRPRSSNPARLRRRRYSRAGLPLPKGSAATAPGPAADSPRAPRTLVSWLASPLNTTESRIVLRASAARAARPHRSTVREGLGRAEPQVGRENFARLQRDRGADAAYQKSNPGERRHRYRERQKQDAQLTRSPLAGQHAQRKSAAPSYDATGFHAHDPSAARGKFPIMCTSTSVVWRRHSARTAARRCVLPVAVSRLPVGSSANSTAGRVTKARAIATRCCSPPDSCRG